MPNVTIDTNVDILASRDDVWVVLTDFSSYDEWCPTMRIEGALEVGSRLTVHMSGDDGHGMSFKPEVLAAIPDKELRWLGKLGLHGIVEGEHYFILSTNEDGSTHLNHGECFSGVLVAFAKGSAEKGGSGYEAFSVALKERVEHLNQAESPPGRHSGRRGVTRGLSEGPWDPTRIPVIQKLLSAVVLLSRPSVAFSQVDS